MLELLQFSSTFSGTICTANMLPSTNSLNSSPLYPGKVDQCYSIYVFVWCVFSTQCQPNCAHIRFTFLFFLENRFHGEEFLFRFSLRGVQVDFQLVRNYIGGFIQMRRVLCDVAGWRDMMKLYLERLGTKDKTHGNGTG